MTCVLMGMAAGRRQTFAIHYSFTDKFAPVFPCMQNMCILKLVKKDTDDFTPERIEELRNNLDTSDIQEIKDFSKGRLRNSRRGTDGISDERVAIVPTPDDESPEMARRARLAHVSHPEWY